LNLFDDCVSASRHNDGIRASGRSRRIATAALSKRRRPDAGRKNIEARNVRFRFNAWKGSAALRCSYGARVRAMRQDRGGPQTPCRCTEESASGFAVSVLGPEAASDAGRGIWRAGHDFDYSGGHRRICDVVAMDIGHNGSMVASIMREGVLGALK
jgi:hypothetical protein